MTVKDTILFGKYRVIRTLGRGRNGTVYLALHVELNEYRAIKQVPKEAADYSQFLREALLLKRFRHPGIPIVYDVFDDEQFSYLVEEFLEGNSLYDLVEKGGPLNQDTAVRYGIQICDLIHYLHSAEEIPVLYLDLQPRNLLVCHGQVKLLDFDHSDTAERSNQAVSRYGTPGYAAPEQWGNGRLDVYTDIYQIGAVLCYLLTGRTEREGPVPDEFGKLSAVIRRCLREDGEERYATARQVRDELMELHSNTERGVRLQSPPLIIALVGSRPGVGVTHLAIGLTVHLNRLGYPALYEEWNDSNDVRAMAENLSAPPDSYGIYTVFRQPMKPRYGQAVSLRSSSYPLIVRDYGTDMKAVLSDETAGQLTAVWLVRGGKWWERGVRIPEALSARKDFCVLQNQTVPGMTGYRKGAGEQTRCYRTPVFADPFQPGEDAASFYGEILSRTEALSGREDSPGRGGSGRKGFPGRQGFPGEKGFPGREGGSGLWACLGKARHRRESRSRGLSE